MRKIKSWVLFGLILTVIFGAVSIDASIAFGDNGSKYQCPMHPSFISDKPGDCSICGMKLVKISGVSAEPRMTSKRKILFYRHPMRSDVISQVPAKDEMGMDYAPVYSEESGSADTESGCYFHECPMIKQGQPCPMLILSAKGEIPECPVCKQKIELSMNRKRIASSAGYATIMITPDKQKLIGIEISPVGNAGMEKTIRVAGEIVEAEKNPIHTAPRGQALVYAKLDKKDAALIKPGQVVRAEIPKLPGSPIEGRIQYVDTVPNKKTRLVKVRAFLPNPRGELKPDMSVSLLIKTGSREGLSVPESAVFVSDGTRLVFVDKGNSVFEPRPVTLGQWAGGAYEIKEGLESGERIITNGTFLVDSESRLKAALDEMVKSEDGKPK